MHFRCVLLGLDWAKPMMFLMLHVTCSCISHAYVPSIISIFYIDLCLVLFCFSLSLSLSHVSCSIAPKQKSTPSRHHLSWHLLFLPQLILLHLTLGSMMIKPEMIFEELFPTWHSFEIPSHSTFIRNAKSFDTEFI